MPLGRMLITLGIVLIVVGVLVSFAGRLPFRLGHLPGDIHIQGKNVTVYLPITTCILLSALISLVMWLVRR
jgi:heme/copper-type cytochrome/quinol oxidase subunit 2